MPHPQAVSCSALLTTYLTSAPPGLKVRYATNKCLHVRFCVSGVCFKCAVRWNSFRMYDDDNNDSLLQGTPDLHSVMISVGWFRFHGHSRERKLLPNCRAWRQCILTPNLLSCNILYGGLQSLSISVDDGLVEWPTCKLLYSLFL